MPRFLNLMVYYSLVIIATNLIVLLFVVASQSLPPPGGSVPALYGAVAIVAVIAILASTVYVKRSAPKVKLPVKPRATRRGKRKEEAAFKTSPGSWSRAEMIFKNQIRSIRYSIIEETIPILFQRHGFSIRIGAQFAGRSGITHEVDLFAVKGRRAFAVEVKKFTLASPDVSAFVAKLIDLPKDHRATLPLIVSRGFTPKAARIAKRQGVKLFDAETLSSLEELLQGQKQAQL